MEPSFRPGPPDFRPVTSLMPEYFDEFVIVGRVTGTDAMKFIRHPGVTAQRAALMFAMALASMQSQPAKRKKVSRRKK